jgi:hypothetical protein
MYKIMDVFLSKRKRKKGSSYGYKKEETYKQTECILYSSNSEEGKKPHNYKSARLAPFELHVYITNQNQNHGLSRMNKLFKIISILHQCQHCQLTPLFGGGVQREEFGFLVGPYQWKLRPLWWQKGTSCDASYCASI